MDQEQQKAGGGRRRRLSRDIVLRAAVDLADESGVESVSMRNLAARLDVVPMALYNHVANKDELLDGMTDMVVGEIDPPPAPGQWRSAVRGRILSARRVMLRHPWARQLIESRAIRTPAVLAYMDSMAGTLRVAGFSVELTHQLMHAIGPRMWGFNHEIFPGPERRDAGVAQGVLTGMVEAHPYLAEIAAAYEGGRACDPQVEFEFTLDLLLDGFERVRRRERVSSGVH